MSLCRNASFPLCLLLVLFFLFAPPVFAHFKLNLNVRVIHVEHMADGLVIYMRQPMPYLVAHLLGEADADGLPAPAPYTYNRMEEDVLVHYVDPAQLQDSPGGLASLARDGLVLEVDGNQVDMEIEHVRVHPIGTQPRFATLEDAKRAYEEAQSFSTFEDGLYVGNTTVDVMLRYAGDDAPGRYRLSSRLDPGLPDQDETANLILDYGPGGVQVFRASGLLHEPIEVTRSVYDAVITFVGEGVKHILDGLDHVLFVVCLVLGAMRLRPLFWRVTGFTIGHSITLSLGFLGYVPTAAWFVPAVETGIALSIIYVAILAILPNSGASARSGKSEWTVAGVTGLIGLLHGLGFSFVVQNILQVTSPNIWQSLLAFNIGVEIGQVLIILLTLSLFYLVDRLGHRMMLVSRYLAAGSCAAVSLVWVFERGSAMVLNM